VVFALIKKLMAARGLDQAGLAEVMGVKLQRVRDLSSGRAKKLTREESEALISELQVRAEWLVTGEGAMFQGEETQDAFIARQRAINYTNALINAMPLSEETRLRLSVLVSGDPLKDGPLIAGALLGAGNPSEGEKQTTISVGRNHGQVVEGGQVNHGPLNFGTGKAPRKKT